MKNLFKIFILALLMLTPLSAQELTKSSVKDMLEDMNTAASNLDIDSIVKKIHPNASITMNITINNQKQVMRVTKVQYEKLLRQGLKASTSYKHEISNLEIQLQDGKAFASMHIKETIEINNQVHVGESIENLTIELIGGEIIITGIVAFTTL